MSWTCPNCGCHSYIWHQTDKKDWRECIGCHNDRSFGQLKLFGNSEQVGKSDKLEEEVGTNFEPTLN